MKVVVRVRPHNSREADQRTVVRVVDGQMLMFDPKEEDEDFFFQGIKQNNRNFCKKQNKDISFCFDCVFDGESSNEDVHASTTKLILDGLLDGYNCSVFAYGATGSGKTHTMLGNVESPGITFLTVMELFERLERMKEEKTVDVAVSYLEVYNENIKDLLAPNGILQIREDSRRGVIVPGLTIYKPQAADELLEMLHKGNKHRTQHPTDANAESSRSHAVFTVYVKQQDRHLGGLSNQVRVAKMALIDLAGSERATLVSGGNASRQREGANINKSLLALGNCINALADRKPKGHVPYRNSKLTRILKDSLDGNCYTVMIAAVSPSMRSYDDTHNTLKYAGRAKNIKTNLKQNVVNVDIQVGQYAKVVQELRGEIAMLKKQLEDKPTEMAVDCPVVYRGSMAPVQPPFVVNDDKEKKLRSVFEELFAARNSLNNQFADVLRQVLDVDLRVVKRQKCLERLETISVNDLQKDRSASKMDNALSKMASRKERLLSRKSSLESRLRENKFALANAEDKATAMQSKVLIEWLKAQHVEVNARIHSYQAGHALRFAMLHDEENRRTDKLLSDVVRVVKRQYLLLKANNLASSDVEEDFGGILKQVEGFKEVAWADQLQTGDESASVNQFKLDEILVLPKALMKSSSDVHGLEDRHTLSKPALTKHATIVAEQSAADSRAIGSIEIADKSRSGTAASRSLHLSPATVACDSTFNTSPVALETATPTLDSTFVKNDPIVSNAGRTPPASVAAADVAVPDSKLLRSGRRLTFEALGPSSILTNPNKENFGTPCSAGGTVSGLAMDRKRALSTVTDIPMEKKLKHSASMSNLSNIINLRKLGYPSMFDRKKKVPQNIDGLQHNPAARLSGLKMRPTKKNHAQNHPYFASSSTKRTMASSTENLSSNSLRKPPVPHIQPRSNILSRMRSKSSVNLKSS